MIKRMNKLTALLVAATAAASIAPATSASAATRLETQEASLDSVQAFDGGKYVFNGYRNEDQDSATYFFNGTKDIEIENVDGEKYTKYGKSSLNFENSDNTLFDLETGKADEDTVEDKVAYMQTKFNTSVAKKVKKYKNSELSDISVETQINADQFGDVWYEYGFKGEDSYTGYISSEGKYIDVTETANITFYDGKTKHTFDEMSDENDGFTLKAGETLFADADYIYRVVEVIKGTSVEQSFIQKISKAQGETVDGAYIPKSVTSYEVSKEDLETIKEALDSENSEVRVVKGSIFVVDGETKDKVTIKKFDLVRERDDNSDITDRINKVKYDTKYDDVEDEDAYDFDIDVDGNVWILYKGNIQKVVNGSLTTMYTVDRTMNEMSVYDENDIVVWNSKDNIFATVAGKTADKEEDKEETVQAGWVKNSDGTWVYNKADGTKATGWLNDRGTWYYLDANGIMQTGWLNLNGTWYYLNGSGAMQTGWLNLSGTWYYLQSSGAMKTGWLNDNGTWYYLQSSGAMKTGWLNDNGTWYYLNPNGSMKTGWLHDTDGNWYYLQESGAMAKNTTIDGYRLGSNGAWIR